MILNARTIAIFILITAFEAFGLNFVWEKVMVESFSFTNIEVGQMFIILLVGKWFTRPGSIIGMTVNGLLDIRDILYFSAISGPDSEAKEEKLTEDTTVNK